MKSPLPCHLISKNSKEHLSLACSLIASSSNWASRHYVCACFISIRGSTKPSDHRPFDIVPSQSQPNRSFLLGVASVSYISTVPPRWRAVNDLPLHHTLFIPRRWGQGEWPTGTICKVALDLDFTDAFAAVALDVFGEFDEGEHVLLRWCVSCALRVGIDSVRKCPGEGLLPETYIA